MEKATGGRRPRLSAEQRRESILDAAAEVFATSGYRATKVADVAAKLGVTEPVIFQNFGSKAALYAAVLDRVARDIRADFQTLDVHNGSAAELLAHVVRPRRGAGDRSTRLHAALFTDAVALAADETLAGPAKRAVRTVADHFRDLVRRAQSDGDIAAGVDPEAAAWLLLSVLAGRPGRAAAMPKRHHLEEGVSALVLSALGLAARSDATRREHAHHPHPA